MESAARVGDASSGSGVVGEDHLADDGVEGGQLRRLAHVSAGLRIGLHGVEIVLATPLGVVNDPAPVDAAVQVGGNEARLPGHYGRGGLGQNVNQLLLILRFHGENVDQSQQLRAGRDGGGGHGRSSFS